MGPRGRARLCAVRPGAGVVGLGAACGPEPARRPALRARHDAAGGRQRPDRDGFIAGARVPQPRLPAARRRQDPRSPAQRGRRLRHRPALHRQLRIQRGLRGRRDGRRDNPADKRCRGGFVCMWPMTVGTFACQKLCVCTDFVNAPAGRLHRSRPPASSGAARCTASRRPPRRRSVCERRRAAGRRSRTSRATTSKRKPPAAGVSASR